MSVEHDSDASTEHFFTAFTDLLVGVIFLFILMLMVFALNLKHPEEAAPVVTTEQVRANILSEVARRMQARGLPIALDLANGVVRLPESLLFGSGEWVLSERGQHAVAALAQVFEEVLPCASHAQKPCEWQAQPVLLDSVLIEGHTDRRPFASPDGYGNWELSAFRAIAVYKEMVTTAPELETALANAQQQPLLGVSAYADRRPVDAAALDPNRRIDVRFNMRANAIPTP